MQSVGDSSGLGWLGFALATVVTWGLYGVLLLQGQVSMAYPVNGRYRAFLFVGVAYFLAAVLAPLGMLLSKSFLNSAGQFVGIANYLVYFQTPSLAASLWNTVWIALATTAIVLPLAFGYAYALTRTRMPAKGLLTAVAMLPLFAPSLLPAISFIYIFGNQGFLKSWLLGA